MNQLFDKLLFCSSIDYPRPSLDLDIWENEDNFYFLREDVKNKILDLLDKYPEEDLLQTAREIRIVGSLGSNLYQEDTDLDVHIVPEDFSKWNEDRVKEVMDWYKENESLDRTVGTHPIEIYVQLDPNQDLLSISLYDVLEDTWIVGPKVAPLDYDPYEEFSYLENDIQAAFEEADLAFGELKRDVIDYDTIKKALEHLPKENQKKLLQRMKNKLGEIESDIERLYVERGNLVDIRFKRGTSEEARKDVAEAEKWADANAIFKFSNRYNYLRVIGELEKLIQDDGEITPDEIDTIRGIVGR